MSELERDVIVIGGGPAGTTAATLVAQKGQRVLLLDREKFPRFRIGESLMPATYWTLQRLGVLGKMRCSDYPDKHSVQFFAHDGRSSSPFYFSEVDDHESSQTWQVERNSFDKMLLDHAAESGVEVREQANVKEILFEGQRVVGVDVENADGSRQRISSKVLVDASGQTGLISRRLKLREVDARLRNAAFYTRFEGAKFGSGRDAGATLIMRTEDDRSWFWFIPLPNGIVSVGVVGPIDYLTKNREGVPQQVFDEELSRCAALQSRLEDARQIEGVDALRDFSYISRRIAGDGWVMAGDAFGFLDPIYSTGVFLAMKSGELAADSIISAFEKNEFSATELGQHGDMYLAAMESLRKLVYAYYEPGFSIARFLKKHPQYRTHVVNLLVGNVFRAPVDGLFETMAQEIPLPESRRLDPAGEMR